MRIAIFSPSFYPEVSGIATTVVTTGKELAKLGHEIAYFVPKYSKKNYETIGVPHEELNLGENIRIIRVSSFPYPTGTKQGRFIPPLCFLSIKEVAKFNADVNHTNDIVSPGLEALLCSRIRKKPLVGTDHTPMLEFMKYSPLKGAIAERTVSNYDAWYYNQCDFVSSPCNAIFDALKEHGFGKPKHKVIANPIEVDKFVPLKNKWPLKKKFGIFDYSVLYIGRLAYEKKVDVTIKAVANLVKKAPKLGLVIAGVGSYASELKALVKRLGVEDRIKFFGYLKNSEDMDDLYNASDLFVMTSVAETQSIVMMQAMACKLPVIAVKAWGLPEYVNEKNGILVEPGDVDELTKQILYLYENQGVALKLGEGGRTFAEQFTPEKIAKEWEKVYMEVIASHRASK